MNFQSVNTVQILTIVGMAITSSPALAGNKIEFNRDVLPILTNNCFKCHGPDPNTRQAQLRLDSYDDVVAPRDNGAAIVPGVPQSSMLLSRITAQGDDRMPPVDSNLELTSDEIDLLTRWIQEGAAWEMHWAFKAPSAVEVPDVLETSWPRTEIDHFILAKLEHAGMNPNPAAGRRTLIRRVSLDLNGLPPTQEDVESFVNDAEPNAYERVVDRLLASPRYGEHVARSWLDLARYADSQGFEKDNPRVMWRYRDWVINALNDDLAFDEFTRAQLAGDLLESPDLEQLIATGFHRNTQTNTEGGTDNEEFRSAAVIDRVNTTMQGWMGLTIGCAQCHAHKYDPINHEEYYKLYAFFNQTEDADLDDDAPFIKAPTALQHEELQQRNATYDMLNQRLTHSNQDVQNAVEEWVAARPSPTVWAGVDSKSLEAESGATLTMDDEGVVHATGAVPLTDTYVLELDTGLHQVTALRLEAIEGSDGHGPGRTSHGNFVVNEITVQSTRPESTPVVFSGTEATLEQPDFLIAKAVDGDVSPTSGWAIAPVYDRDQSAVFRFSEPLDTSDGTPVRITIQQTYGTQHVLEHFRLTMTDQRGPALPLPQALEIILDTPDHDRDDQQREQLARYVLEHSDSLASQRNELAVAKQEQETFMMSVPNALVLRELADDKQRTTRLFLGGSFLAPDTERGTMEPDVPAILHDFPEALPRNRLGLAEWLVHPKNPMTSRVQVNRLWAELFGAGLVSTVDDFGVQGARPSHPALLDWLALHWMNELHWSPKALTRLIVTSEVYRQDATLNAPTAKLDPENKLLGRAPRLRLTAEQLRDQALFTSGLLIEDRIGGPSVLPHLPEGMLPQAFTSLVLKPSTGDDLYRRGLYTTWRRTGHYPSFATFDAPSREFCLITRQRSNTPLQALVLLNDAVFVEAAQAMARLLIEREQDDIDERISTLFSVALSRTPTEQEHAILHELYKSTFVEAMSDPDQARTLATIPRGALPDTITAEDAAAMTAVCNVVFNLDEYLNRP